MPPRPPLPSRPTAPLCAADGIALGILGVAIVAGPVMLGGTGAWARLALEFAVTAAVVAWSVTDRISGRWPGAVVAGALVLCLQILPLSHAVLAWVAPVSAAAWKVSLTGMPGSTGSISIDPATTAAGIRRLLLMAAAIVVVADVGRLQQGRRFLSLALATVCVVIWALGLVFPFDKRLVLLGFIDCNGPIAAEFWKTPLVPPIATNGSGNLDWVNVAGQRYAMPTWIAADGFGPYIYSNHFAGAMCLTLPMLLAVWLWLSRDRLPGFIRRGLVALLVAAALWTVGIRATSRAGGAALLLAILVFASLACDTPRLRRIAWGMTAAYGLLLVGLTSAMHGLLPGVEKVFPVEIQPRILSLLSDARVVASQVALRMFVASPCMGSGLGTFGELFPRFTRGDALLNYAHNDCAQWLAETGLVGGGLAGGLLTLLARRFQAWRLAPREDDRLLGAAAWAALAGIGFHSLFDWNLHIPANALLACVVAGLAAASGVVAGQITSARGGMTLAIPWLTLRGPAILLALACVAALGWLARDAVSETAQRHLREAIVAARIAATDSGKPDAAPALIEAIDGGERMAAWDPANAQLAALLGQAHLHLSTAEQPIDDANAHLVAAEVWFRVARRRRAVDTGLSEPVPVSSPKTGR